MIGFVRYVPSSAIVFACTSYVDRESERISCSLAVEKLETRLFGRNMNRMVDKHSFRCTVTAAVVTVARKYNNYRNGTTTSYRFLLHLLLLFHIPAKFIFNFKIGSMQHSHNRATMELLMIRTIWSERNWVLCVSERLLWKLNSWNRIIDDSISALWHRHTYTVYWKLQIFSLFLCECERWNEMENLSLPLNGLLRPYTDTWPDASMRPVA